MAVLLARTVFRLDASDLAFLAKRWAEERCFPITVTVEKRWHRATVTVDTPLWVDDRRRADLAAYIDEQEFERHAW